MSWLNSFKKDPLVDLQLQLVKYSAEAANIHCDRIKSDKSESSSGTTDSKWVAIFFEYLYFYLWWTNISIFDRLGAEKTDKVMEAIGLPTINAAVDSICKEWPKEHVEKVKGECINNLEVSFNEYAKYKILFHGEGEPLKGTLFWEFGKVVAKLTGEWPNLGAVIGIELITIELLKEIKKFVDNVVG